MPPLGRAPAGSVPPLGRAPAGSMPPLGRARAGVSAGTLRVDRQKGVTMTLEDNKAIVRRFVQEIFVEGRSASIDELVADDLVSHTWGSGADSKAYLRTAMERLSAVLAEGHFTIEDMIAEGDRVAVRVTAGATQVGEFMGLPPSGKAYVIGEIHIFRIRGGKVVEHWHQYDQLGMMRQLGALPG
jgi:steroid delta-isomerase-like uncharacterized protein